RSIEGQRSRGRSGTRRTLVIGDGALPDEALPDEAFPDGALPDEALPEEALPDHASRLTRQSRSRKRWIRQRSSQVPLSSSLQNANVLSATASSEKYCIALARPACARGRRWSTAARRRSAAESASGSSPGTTTPASPITSGVAPPLVPTTVTSCAIASATTCAAGSAHVGSPRAGSTRP